jgi:hypothetical protein
VTVVPAASGFVHRRKQIGVDLRVCGRLSDISFYWVDAGCMGSGFSLFVLLILIIKQPGKA